ncbi:Rrf2 family transcriptional regulator [Sinimarinibacterium sp. CAU 1509]|uniref:RrF2 family transcriptional regulator n=1 Tax=Sinimarinibacterium sp. CAU 1509 TaxID=2562283 RepID=UPI0010AD544E|nr:Rrf2 family transcriptional regulator [Sinimarinibacterium sp. CAU 1509]TJY56257.1 Rrf2 family transcriptional regulator [Sinimarinibacterium sp. CAU 1509]
MRLTAFTDYGLRVLMRLAGAPDRLFTTDKLAEEFGISRNHLAKVVQDLARAGFIRTQRGAGGGFMLAVAPGSISLGDVVRQLEQRQSLVECFRSDGGACSLTPRCRLKSRLVAAQEAFLTELDRTSLAECVYVPGSATLSTSAIESSPVRAARSASAQTAKYRGRTRGRAL